MGDVDAVFATVDAYLERDLKRSNISSFGRVGVHLKQRKRCYKYTHYQNKDICPYWIMIEIEVECSQKDGSHLFAVGYTSCKVYGGGRKPRNTSFYQDDIADKYKPALNDFLSDLSNTLTRLANTPAAEVKKE